MALRVIAIRAADNCSPVDKIISSSLSDASGIHIRMYISKSLVCCVSLVAEMTTTTYCPRGNFRLFLTPHSAQRLYRLPKNRRIFVQSAIKPSRNYIFQQPLRLYQLKQFSSQLSGSLPRTDFAFQNYRRCHCYNGHKRRAGPLRYSAFEPLSLAVLKYFVISSYQFFSVRLMYCVIHCDTKIIEIAQS